VVGCVAVALSPERARDWARGKVLDFSAGRSTSDPAVAAEGPATDGERRLKNEIALLRQKVADQERALDEAQVANVLTTDRDDLRLFPAEAFPLAGPQDLVRRLILGRGERDGIRKGAPVVAGSALVGTILQTTRERSEVRLVTDPCFRLRVLAHRLGIEGILAGTGGPWLVFVPAPTGDDRAKELRAGDELLVSRASTLCSVPAVVGIVRDVERPAGEAGFQAVVVPAVSIGRLTRVEVIGTVDAENAPLARRALEAERPESPDEANR
jgi:rod shape-determining protein MreC